MSNVRKSRPRPSHLQHEPQQTGWLAQSRKHFRRLEARFQDLVGGQGRIKRPKGSIAGVCAGLGEYFGINPTWLRLGFLAGIFFGGTSIFLYAALAIVIPRNHPSRRLGGQTAEMEPYPWEEDYIDEPAYLDLQLCEACDTALKPDARFCHNCGQAVSEAEGNFE